MAFMRERSNTSRWDGWDIWIVLTALVGGVFVFFPEKYYALVPIVVVILAEYLWSIGFFNYPKYHSRHDEEVAKRMEAKKRRLEIEDQVRRQMEEQYSHDLQELAGREP